MFNDSSDKSFMVRQISRLAQTINCPFPFEHEVCLDSTEKQLGPHNLLGVKESSNGDQQAAVRFSAPRAGRARLRVGAASSEPGARLEPSRGSGSKAGSRRSASLPHGDHAVSISTGACRNLRISWAKTGPGSIAESRRGRQEAE